MEKASKSSKKKAPPKPKSAVGKKTAGTKKKAKAKASIKKPKTIKKTTTKKTTKESPLKKPAVVKKKNKKKKSASHIKTAAGGEDGGPAKVVVIKVVSNEKVKPIASDKKKTAPKLKKSAVVPKRTAKKTKEIGFAKARPLIGYSCDCLHSYDSQHNVFLIEYPSPPKLLIKSASDLALLYIEKGYKVPALFREYIPNELMEKHRGLPENTFKKTICMAKRSYKDPDEFFESYWRFQNSYVFVGGPAEKNCVDFLESIGK